jgi:ERF superfamily
MNFSEQINEISAALAKFQGEVSNPSKDGDNGHFKSKYATLDEIVKVIRPTLSKHGLSFIQSVNSDSEKVGVTTTLLHSSGQYITSDTINIPLGGKVNAHGVGAGVTYGRRFSLGAILGIATEEDDDGNHVSVGGDQKQQSSKQTTSNGASDAQKNMINRLIKEVAKVRNTTEAITVGNLKASMQLAKDITEYTQTEASKAIEILNKAKEVVA